MRQSNFELLRVVSMMMVLLVHIDGASLGLPNAMDGIATLTAPDWWRLIVEAVAIIGVNCFTMISGYFGIKLTVKNAVRFLLECMIYSVAIYVAMCIAKPGGFSLRGLIESVMVLTHTDLWYIPAYFILMLLSPWLNAGMQSLDSRRFNSLMAVFTLVTVWMGWWNGGSFNPTGYTVMQLVYVYLLGGWTRRCLDVKLPRAAWLSLWGVSIALIVASCLWLPTLKTFAYNSPFVLMATLACFMVFREMSFQSRVVNWLARGSLAVYLIHKAPPVWGGIMRPTVVKLWHSMSLMEFTLAAVGLAVGIYMACAVVDTARRWIEGRLLFRRDGK